jgi:hypothetical protein
MPASREDWERVGALLIDRRIEISPRYANRRAFAEETGLNWRTLHDAEYGKRATFKPETVRAFEAAYRLVPGSLARTLAGGGLEPLAAPAPPRPVPAAPSVTTGTPAERERDRLLTEHPDDEILAMISRRSGGEGAVKVSQVVMEMLDWLGSQGPWPAPQEQDQNGTTG